MEIDTGEEEVIKYSYICGICGKKTEHHRVCSICGRDLCSSCTKFNLRDMGDYLEKYCELCFNIGQKYLDQISIEEEKCDAIVKNLKQGWRDEAVKAIKNDKK